MSSNGAAAASGAIPLCFSSWPAALGGRERRRRRRAVALLAGGGGGGSGARPEAERRRAKQSRAEQQCLSARTSGAGDKMCPSAPNAVALHQRHCAAESALRSVSPRAIAADVFIWRTNSTLEPPNWIGGRSLGLWTRTQIDSLCRRLGSLMRAANLSNPRALSPTSTGGAEHVNLSTHLEFRPRLATISLALKSYL